MDREEVLRILRSTPDEVQAVCEGLSDDQVRTRPAAEAWSLLEIACHLRDSAAEEGLRVRRLIEEEQPTLDAYDQEARAREREYQREDPRRALTGLRAFWTGLAYQLEGLSEDEWQREGIHPEVGRVSVRSRAEDEVRHAREHLAQMQDVRAALSG